MPVIVNVITLPSFATARRAVLTTLPDFFRVAWTVWSLICRSVMVSKSSEPLTGYSFPSYLAVYSNEVFFPSASTLSPVRLMPSVVSSYVIVALLGGGPGLYLDFATLSFQVPIAGSAAHTGHPQGQHCQESCRFHGFPLFRPICSPASGPRGWVANQLGSIVAPSVPDGKSAGPATTRRAQSAGMVGGRCSNWPAYATRHIASPAAAFSQLRSGLIASSNAETSSRAT